VSTIEELLGRINNGSGLKTEFTAGGILHADHVAPLYPQKLSLTPTSGGHSVGIIRSRTQATEVVLPRNICVWLHSEHALHGCVGGETLITDREQERMNLANERKPVIVQWRQTVSSIYKPGEGEGRLF
jgi:hypothetical protein